MEDFLVGGIAKRAWKMLEVFGIAVKILVVI
jgi:hypothetical protein